MIKTSHGSACAHGNEQPRPPASGSRQRGFLCASEYLGMSTPARVWEPPSLAWISARGGAAGGAASGAAIPRSHRPRVLGNTQAAARVCPKPGGPRGSCRHAVGGGAEGHGLVLRKPTVLSANGHGNLGIVASTQAASISDGHVLPHCEFSSPLCANTHVLTRTLMHTPSTLKYETLFTSQTIFHLDR